MLPESTILGILRIIEIYEFYNKPVLFACQNNTGHIYLVVWIDEKDDRDIWLYTPISSDRFECIRSGEIDLHDAFVEPEDGITLEVTVYKEPSHLAKIRLIPAEELDESWVPLSGDYLDIPDSLPSVLWENVDQRNISRQVELIEA